MRKYIPGGGLDSAASFSFDTSQFGNLELVAILDNLVQRNVDISWNFGIGGTVWASPAIHDGVVFFGARDKCFYAVDISSGRLVWKYKSRGYPNDIFAYNRLMYIGICENDLYAVNEKTGRELWTFPTNGWVVKFVEHEGRIIFSSWDCHVYCITPDGKLVWKFSTSLGNQASIDLDQEGKGGSFEVTWAPEEETEEKSEEVKESSDYGQVGSQYGLNMSEYAGGIGTDYTGKKKRGYV
jgi:outer membrane protein assembly factor BamB